MNEFKIMHNKGSEKKYIAKDRNVIFDIIKGSCHIYEETKGFQIANNGMLITSFNETIVPVVGFSHKKKNENVYYIDLILF
jgi:hypothetical protein